MKRRRLIAYVAFGILSLLTFIVFQFPYDVVKSRMAIEIENRLGEDYNVQIESLHPFPLSSLVFKNLSIRQLSTGETVATIDKGVIRLKILPLLWGSVKAKLKLDSKGGRLNGSLAYRSKRIKLNWVLNDFDLGRFPILTQASGLHFKSVIEGKGEAKLDTVRPEQNTALIQLNVRDLRIADSDIKVGEGEMAMDIHVPASVLASQEHPGLIHVSLEKGRFEFKQFELSGGDLEMKMDGKIFVSNQIQNSRISLRGDLGLSSKLVEAFPYVAFFEKEKNELGRYPLTVSGRFVKPAIRIGSFKLPTD